MSDPPPDTLSATDSWQTYNGTYIFTISNLKTTDSLWGDYCNSLITKVAALTKDAAKAVSYPTDDPYKGIIWVDDVVNPNATGSQPKISIADGVCLFLLNEDINLYITTKDEHIGFGNLKVPIPISMEVVPASNKSTYSRTQSDIHGLVITYIQGWAPNADFPPNPEYQWYIGFDPTDCGMLQGQFAIKNLNQEVLRDWAPGFRHDIQPDTTSGSSDPISQFYPLFEDNADAYVLYDLQWKPYDTQKTSLGFGDRSVELNSTQNVPSHELNWPDATTDDPKNLLAFRFDQMTFPSCLKNVYDSQGVHLIPQSDAAMVIGDYTDTDGSKRYYFMPSGGFEVALANSESYKEGDPIKLLCGLAGTEFIQLVPRYNATFGDILKFKPAATLNKQTNITTYTQSYATVERSKYRSDDPVYFSQPKSASLFKYDDNPLGTTDQLVHPILASTDVKNAVLTTKVNAFPMVPYGNVVLSPGLSWIDLTNYELTQLAMLRKKTISEQTQSSGAIANVVATTTPTTTATPQGFIAEYSTGGLNWNSVTMALSQIGKFEFLPEGTASYIPNKLRDTLQSNQLFMVATTQNNGAEKNILGTLNSQITIDGWPFEAVVPETVQGNDYNNVLIFKFSHGTLKDLVLDYQKWNHGTHFNQDPQQAATWIYDYISQAELAVQKANDAGKSAQASWLQNFVDIVNNPSWNGVLLLKVDVSVQSFPKELEGLIAGINLKEFYGHHIGFNVNHLEHTTSGLQIQHSSIFGLINYVATDSDSSTTSAQTTTNSTAPVYEFEVLNLQVQFENSKVRHFSSKIQLTTNSWFNEKATLNQSSGIQGFGIHAIEMDGHLEHHNGQNVYTFITKPNQVYQFNMKSHVLKYVEITQAKFTTLHISDPVPPPTKTNTSVKTITTRFTFSGFMNFNKQSPFDVFSYGNQDTTEPNGLAFNNLFVDMDFELSTNNATDQSTVLDQTFDFDPSGIAFDMALTTPRDQSMYNKFPLTLRNLTYSNISKAEVGEGAQNTPSNLGYMAISINTDSKFSALGETWYGLEYNLNMGTPGALASKMDFTASIITAWSPGGSGLQMDVGIKLPGSGGAKKLLSLENVIRLSIDEILFEAIAQDGNEAKLAYILNFFNIGLKFFGIHLPLHGAFNASVFGDPAGAHNSTSSVGWYAAYDNMTKK